MPFAAAMELCDYWHDAPPSSAILRVIAIALGAMKAPRTMSASNTSLTPAEASYTAEPARSFDSLPAYAKAFLQEAQSMKRPS